MCLRITARFAFFCFFCFFGVFPPVAPAAGAAGAATGSGGGSGASGCETMSIIAAREVIFGSSAARAKAAFFCDVRGSKASNGETDSYQM